ncbi:dihydroorotase [Virgibacillus sp. W0430]|uniref:dihydroorotase n=1 Tax=Virgibacillus sp. W0430 TaxID=3391580 RepID=UPI003F4888C7
MKILLKNAKRLLPQDKIERCEVLIENKKIKQIMPEITAENVDQVIDCKGNLVTPGFIDVHIHLREPGGEHKETINTGTEAAARGGYTTVCAMPNTSPVPDSKENILGLLTKIEKNAVIRVLPYASITKNLAGEALTNFKEIVDYPIFAFTDDGVGIQTAHTMLEAMKEARAVNKPIVAHCEDNSILYDGVLHEGEVSDRLRLPGIPSACESVQIARDVLLAEMTGCHYHVCHVSTKESVRIIRDAKNAGIHVTAEVTPHHLLLNEKSIIEDDANYKMNPPLRSEADQLALIEGLLDGTIDFIATDHAPHAEKEKAKGFLNAPFGIVGLETAFSLLYTGLVKEGIVTLHQLIDWLTIKPAHVFQLPYGRLEEGYSADITLIDLNKAYTIDKHTFLSKGKNTPFDQQRVNGMPIMTIYEGEIVFKEIQ